MAARDVASGRSINTPPRPPPPPGPPQQGSSSLMCGGIVQDVECDRANIPRALFMDHVFAHLLMTYGAKNMVTEFAACLMVSAKRHRALDLRIEVRTPLASCLCVDQAVPHPSLATPKPDCLDHTCLLDGCKAPQSLWPSRVEVWVCASLLMVTGFGATDTEGSACYRCLRGLQPLSGTCAS